MTAATMTALRVAATLVHTLPTVRLRVRDGDRTVVQVARDAEASLVIAPCTFRRAVAGAHELLKEGVRLHHDAATWTFTTTLEEGNSVQQRHRNLAALALAAAALLSAACGESDEQGSPVPSVAGAAPATVAPPRPSTEPDAVSIASATAPYRSFGTAAQPGKFPRTVRHAMGETRIERAPVRVVTLDTGELDAMAELGVKPVGVVDYGADGLPAYFDPKEIEGVEVVGTIQSPNLEAIARLEPDLILSSKLRHEKLYPQLSRIAPTVFAERPGVTWKQNFTLYSQAVGREEAAARTVERYEARVAELNERLPGRRPAVSVVRVMADGNIRLYQRANFLGVLLTDLGFPRPEPQNVDDFATEVSMEQLAQADGDLIIFAVFDATKNTHDDAVIASPLWKQLAGVRSGDVHTVDDQTWIGGIGYRAAFAVMDQLEQFASG